MKGKGRKTNPGIEEKDSLPDYPLYPSNEDIYKKYHKENNINPEDISKRKESAKDIKTGPNNEKVFDDDVSGSDLDIPGAESDDPQKIGNEDEENDYYSLGGDDHNDLDEDKDEL